jgi:hypothetical protein
MTPPADLNGLVHFVERRNLVSARVPSHLKRSLLLTDAYIRKQRVRLISMPKKKYTNSME